MSISECVFHGQQESHHCGYCNGSKQKTRCTHGATFSTLTTEDYQSLMFRGWRRSGVYCYKPVMSEICCPQYTIRCDVAQYQLSRTHRRVLKRMDEFLRTGAQPAQPSSATGAAKQANNSNAAASAQRRAGARRPQAATTAAASPAPKVDADDVDGAGDAPDGRGRMREGKARQKRWARRLAKLRATAESVGSLEAVMAAYRARRSARAAARAPRTLEQLLESEGRAAPTPQPAAKAATAAVKEADGSPRRRLRIVLLPSARREFDAGPEHSLYARYQARVHGDSPAECSLQQFSRFLCDSPLAYARRGDRWLGSFHQQYWLEPEGRLIMVGVIDILPDCTSSVYVFYDPDFAWLSLGTYAALREIAHTRQLGLPHYCMGYYIHDCGKMRYKGAFTGSQLLCPETYTWHCLQTVCVPLLQARDYCRFAPQSVANAAAAPVSPDELQVALGKRGGSGDFLPYRQLAELLSGRPVKAIVDELLRTFARLVGPDCARRMRVRIY